MSQFKRLLSNTNSFAFLLLVLMVVIVLPLNILFIISSRHTTKALLVSAKHNLSNLVLTAAAQTEQRVSLESNYTSVLIRNNEHYLRIVTNSDEYSYNMSKYLLSMDLKSSIKGSHADIYFLYSASRNDFTIVPKNYTDIKHADIQTLAYDYLNVCQGTDWTLRELGSHKCLISAISTNGIYLGSIIVLDFLDDYIPGNLDYKSINVRLLKSLPEVKYRDSKGKISIYSDAIFHVEEFYIECTVDNNEILKDLTFYQRNAYTISLVYPALVPLLILMISFFFLNPLNKLRKAITALNCGNLDYKIPETIVLKEYQNIFTAFNGMTETIKNLKIENYTRELEAQEIKLQNLQLQIRPHFLQNTFGLLYTMCQMGETESIGDFILYLSNYFRYIRTDNKELAPVTEEIKIIKGYIAIAKVQHPNTFEISYDIPDDLSGIYVPQLLLHNFIENIMIHATRRGTFVHILFRLKRIGDTAFLLFKKSFFKFNQLICVNI